MWTTSPVTTKAESGAEADHFKWIKIGAQLYSVIKSNPLFILPLSRFFVFMTLAGLSGSKPLISTTIILNVVMYSQNLMTWTNFCFLLTPFPRSFNYTNLFHVVGFVWAAWHSIPWFVIRSSTIPTLYSSQFTLLLVIQTPLNLSRVAIFSL